MWDRLAAPRNNSLLAELFPSDNGGTQRKTGGYRAPGFLVAGETAAYTCQRMAGRGAGGLWIWVAVFAAGFAVGYVLMSTFVSDPEADGPLPVVDSAPAVPDDGGPGEVEPNAAEPAAAAAAALPEPAVPTPPPVALPDTPEPDAPAEPADPAADAAAPPDPAAVAEPDSPWWEQCRGRVCRVDFHKITGGLSIRKGQIEHGSTVSWEDAFGAAARVAVLGTDQRVELEVRAVAMGADGKPSAAEVAWKKGGRQVVGVISLDLGEPGKQITMRPPPPR